MTLVLEPLFPGQLYNDSERFVSSADRKLSELRSLESREAVLADLWAGISKLGWPLVLYPEEVGGVGAGLHELAAIAEGVGRFAFPLPVVETCGVLPALLGLPDLYPSPALIDGLSDGSIRVATVVDQIAPLSDAFSAAMLAVDGKLSLSGTLHCANSPPSPTHLLLAARAAEVGPFIALIPLDQPSVAIRQHWTMDGARSFSARFGAGADYQAEILAVGEDASNRVERALDLGAFLTTVMAVSSMRSIIEQTASYLLQREQFGKKLASFQVLRHRLAEDYVEYLNCRALVQNFVEGELGPSLSPREVSIAKIASNLAGRKVAQDAIQLHGGMGMTEELAVNRINKQVLASAFRYGTTDFHMARLQGANR